MTQRTSKGEQRRYIAPPRNRRLFNRSLPVSLALAVRQILGLSLIIRTAGSGVVNRSSTSIPYWQRHPGDF
ncbi:hypothetical protein [Sphingopyxis bauzanensis]|uniref:hypothetical protein n=1 Tax=Sphingopyxis bauzanensis TaxID=651663 RepID=UPI001181A3C6|nr:hypothetical protein [Sphingopyxis bauzanensis]